MYHLYRDSIHLLDESALASKLTPLDHNCKFDRPSCCEVYSFHTGAIWGEFNRLHEIDDPENPTKTKGEKYCCKDLASTCTFNFPDVDSKMDRIGSAFTFYFRFVKCAFLLTFILSIISIFMSSIFLGWYDKVKETDTIDSIINISPIFKLRDLALATSLGGYALGRVLTFEANFDSITQLYNRANKQITGADNVFLVECKNGQRIVDNLRYSHYGLCSYCLTQWTIDS